MGIQDRIQGILFSEQFLLHRDDICKNDMPVGTPVGTPVPSCCPPN